MFVKSEKHSLWILIFIIILIEVGQKLNKAADTT